MALAERYFFTYKIFLLPKIIKPDQDKLGGTAVEPSIFALINMFCTTDGAAKIFLTTLSRGQV